MREDQAKTKWCPMIKSSMVQVGLNDYLASPSQNCRGSACMMWRWSRGPIPIPVSKDPIPGEGYCGLAGHRDLGNDTP